MTVLLRSMRSNISHSSRNSHAKSQYLHITILWAVSMTASLLSHQYFNTLRSLLDKHAPIMKKNIPRHAETGFMNCDILKAKRLKRKYEWAWRREKSPVIVADTGLQSTTIISCLRSPNAIIIPTLWLKTKEIPRLCGTGSKRSYTGPLLLFYQTTQIKPTLRTLSVSSSMIKNPQDKIHTAVINTIFSY